MIQKAPSDTIANLAAILQKAHFWGCGLGSLTLLHKAAHVHPAPSKLVAGWGEREGGGEAQESRSLPWWNSAASLRNQSKCSGILWSTWGDNPWKGNLRPEKRVRRAMMIKRTQLEAGFFWVWGHPRSAIYNPCDLGYVTKPPWTLVSSSLKWEWWYKPPGT